ncbi:lactam utilization protein LamB [Haemophilus paracuniculus]|uniref:5-oxoprolinase subunit A n=1 Tax=Haemophilus paracuniculus TaxID=734 RepID=A0A1T0ATV1_9PAST|nr:5-oxoprolinase subunit PxpA [Haemophilus paracuniculus]OOR99802.1 lactam utilization protein LamB [Haemophilus paracuniculus]
MMYVDLNADLAEGFAFDEALLGVVSSANIACGLHAGDAITIQNALTVAKRHGVRVGAHPSFPDRENFGRSEMQLPPQALKAHLLYQLGALQALCNNAGVPISYVKPHGALYNQASRDPELARLIAETVHQFNPNLKLMGLSGSLMLSVAEQVGLGTISEVFADRRYQPDGSLVPRSHPQAKIEDEQEAIEQVIQMITTQTATALDGSTINIKVESICLHGDNAHALLFAEKIRAELTTRGIEIRA